MGKRYVVPRKLTGIVPEIWRRRAEVPLGNASIASDPSQREVPMQRFEDVAYCAHLSEAKVRDTGTRPVLRRYKCG